MHPPVGVCGILATVGLPPVCAPLGTQADRHDPSLAGSQPARHATGLWAVSLRCSMKLSATRARRE